METNFAIAIHGGAGTIPKGSLDQKAEQAYTNALQEALNIGYDLLEKNYSAVEAVEAAVKALEDCPLFNAGRGAVFTNTGTHEMDACIMDGSNLAAGAVCGVSGIKNPIELAKAVMLKSEHVLLSGKGAEDFAKLLQLPFENDDYFYSAFRFEQWQELKNSDVFLLDHSLPIAQKSGTVGAVAIDKNGNLAAATSTGGMTNKKFGRIGDSPIIGAGTYANNNVVAISCTGHGEPFMKAVVAHDVACLMQYKQLNLQAACNEVIMNKLPKINGEGGLIAIDNFGNIALCFNSEGMYRGLKNNQGQNEVAIYR
jgi:beta-aspartyl-peptidase (threonine type)